MSIGQMIKTRFLRGFTLVELLIVMVVIGVLATALIPKVRNIQSRARDTQRLSDIRTFINALNTYHLDNGDYPISTCNFVGCFPCYFKGCTPGLEKLDGSPGGIKNVLVPKYINALPQDPTNGGSYVYDYFYHRSADINYINIQCSSHGYPTKPKSLIQISYIPENPSGNDYVPVCKGGLAWADLMHNYRGNPTNNVNLYPRGIRLGDGEKYYFQIVNSLAQ